MKFNYKNVATLSPLLFGAAFAATVPEIRGTYTEHTLAYKSDKSTREYANVLTVTSGKKPDVAIMSFTLDGYPKQKGSCGFTNVEAKLDNTVLVDQEAWVVTVKTCNVAISFQPKTGDILLTDVSDKRFECNAVLCGAGGGISGVSIPLASRIVDGKSLMVMKPEAISETCFKREYDDAIFRKSPKQIPHQMRVRLVAGSTGEVTSRLLFTKKFGGDPLFEGEGACEQFQDDGNQATCKVEDGGEYELINNQDSSITLKPHPKMTLTKMIPSNASATPIILDSQNEANKEFVLYPTACD